jgi:serine/threonine protein kinase
VHDLAPASIGPYRISGTLGQGGMGIVYRGVHAETGVLAAIKTVRVPNELQLRGLRREVHCPGTRWS